MNTPYESPEPSTLMTLLTMRQQTRALINANRLVAISPLLFAIERQQTAAINAIEGIQPRPCESAERRIA